MVMHQEHNICTKKYIIGMRAPTVSLTQIMAQLIITFKEMRVIYKKKSQHQYFRNFVSVEIFK